MFLTRELLFYLMGQFNYSTIIIDCYGELKKPDILDSLVYSTTIVPVIGPDILSLAYLHTFLGNYEGLIEKCKFVYNTRSRSRGDYFSPKETAKWLNLPILTMLHNDTLDSCYYKGDIPFAKSKPFRQDILKLLKNI